MNTIESSPYTEDQNAITAAKVVIVLYIIAVVPVLLPIAGIAGLVIAYIYRHDARDWLGSHYRFLIRTFWIGIVYLIISSILVLAVVGFVLLFATAVWWIVRCVVSYRLISKQLPHPNPSTWWV
jgi:uncharacterized membrane protein